MNADPRMPEIHALLSPARAKPSAHSSSASAQAMARAAAFGLIGRRAEENVKWRRQ